MGNIIVGQSGGPTSVINASLYGVIKKGVELNSTGIVYGMINGIEGFIDDKVMNLSDFSKDKDFEYLKTTPSSFLGSCRFKLPQSFDDDTYKKIFDQFKKYDITNFFYIGGNDSMDTVSKLSTYAKQNNIEGITFVGVPKTVDDDLVITDHTPGFGSAAKYVATTVRELSVDARVYSNKRTLTIVEIMGRHAGWLTCASALARCEGNVNPVLIYLPERDFDLDSFVNDVNEAFKITNNVVACVSEGIHDKDGRLISELLNGENTKVDSFGHKCLDGTAECLKQLVSDKFDIKLRAISLSTPQRASTRNLSLTDVNEAINAGMKAVEWAFEGKSEIMVAFIRKDSKDYEISYEPVNVNEVCNKEKKVPLEWINAKGNDVTKEIFDYILPLIQGSVDLVEENGIPKCVYRKN